MLNQCVSQTKKIQENHSENLMHTNTVYFLKIQYTYVYSNVLLWPMTAVEYAKTYRSFRAPEALSRLVVCKFPEI